MGKHWLGANNKCLGRLDRDLRHWIGNVLVVKYQNVRGKALLDIWESDIVRIVDDTVR